VNSTILTQFPRDGLQRLQKASWLCPTYILRSIPQRVQGHHEPVYSFESGNFGNRFYTAGFNATYLWVLVVALQLEITQRGVMTGSNFWQLALAID
jgi:hypothetical protein